MSIDELERRIKHLRDNGVSGKTQIVVADNEGFSPTANDIAGLQKEEITYSSVLGKYLINKSGLSKPNAKEVIVIY